MKSEHTPGAWVANMKTFTCTYHYQVSIPESELSEHKYCDAFLKEETNSISIGFECYSCSTTFEFNDKTIPFKKASDIANESGWMVSGIAFDDYEAACLECSIEDAK